MKNEKGSILITALIFMLVMTFMLIAFLEMSSMGLKQTTYAEHAKKAFYVADGALTVSGSAIDMIISEKGVTDVVTNKFPPSLIEFNNDNIYEELMGPSVSDIPLDMTVKSGDSFASVDIKKIGSAEFAAGTSGEFASGYEGIGGGMSAGGIYLFYSVDVVGRTPLGSKSAIMGIYRKVTGVGGGS